MIGGAAQSEDTEYRRPGSIERVREDLDGREGTVKVVAGGQSLSLLMRQDLIHPDVLIDVTDVPELRGIDETDGDRIDVGAAVTYAELAADRRFPDRGMGGVPDATSVIADRQIKRMGTIGGAVAHADPSLDILPILRCFDAQLRIGSVDGMRRVSLDEFFVGYMTTDLASNELIERIEMAVPPRPTGSAYVKHSSIEGGWPTVGVATRVTLEDGAVATSRVALAAVDDSPFRSHTVEDALQDRPVDVLGGDLESICARVGEDIDPLDDLSGSASYKKSLAPVLTQRSLTRAIDRATGEP